MRLNKTSTWLKIESWRFFFILTTFSKIKIFLPKLIWEVSKTRILIDTVWPIWLDRTEPCYLCSDCFAEKWSYLRLEIRKRPRNADSSPRVLTHKSVCALKFQKSVCAPYNTTFVAFLANFHEYPTRLLWCLRILNLSLIIAQSCTRTHLWQ